MSAVGIAVSCGLNCIDVPDVWCWGRHASVFHDWGDIDLTGRTGYVAFDSHLITKAEVRRALEAFTAFLAVEGPRSGLSASLRLLMAAGRGWMIIWWPVDRLLRSSRRHRLIYRSLELAAIVRHRPGYSTID